MGYPPSVCPTCGEEYDFIGIIKGWHICHHVAIQESRTTHERLVEGPMALTQALDDIPHFVPIAKCPKYFKDWAREQGTKIPEDPEDDEEDK